MPNLDLATPLPEQVIVRGENHEVSFHVHNADTGQNFNWSGYTPRAVITVGSASISAASFSVISQAGGTAQVIFTASQTGAITKASWGSLILYADPTANSENLHIATVPVRFTAEAIP
jgi:hypothetical protein